MGLVAREPKRNQRVPFSVSTVKRIGAPSCGSVQVKALLFVRGITYSTPLAGLQDSISATAEIKPDGSLGCVPPSTSMLAPGTPESST